MLGNEIMFYNGFNLFIDLIIAGVVGLSVYRWTRGRAWLDGYGAGCSDTETYQNQNAEELSDYMWETYREQRDALNEIDRDVQELKKLADQLDNM
jgi:hypothetical protein